MADASPGWALGAPPRHVSLATIHDVIAAVRDDLLAGTDPSEVRRRLPGLRIEARLVDSGAADVMSSLAGGETYLFRVSTLTTPQALGCHLADRLQDFVVENLRQGTPPCPSHPHPLTPDVIGDVAVWRCPAVPGWTCPVGGYRRWAVAWRGDRNRPGGEPAPVECDGHTPR